jgi:hypothetical protein
MADEDLDKQENINRSIQERLALLEREKSTLLEEADIYKRLLGTNLDLSQVRSRYQSDEKDILQTIRTNTNILRDQSKQITFQVAEKSRIQKISNDILSISENSYSMMMEELGTSKNIGDIEKKREILAKRLVELESFRGTILFEDKELQAAFNEELENSIKGALDLEAQLTGVQNTSEKIQGNVSWFEALKETSDKIGLGKFTDTFKAAEKAARETATANELSKKVTDELISAKEEEAKAISAVQTAEEELQKLREDNKQTMLDENKQRNDIKKSLKEKEDILSKINNLSQEELETGEGLTAERLKQLGLADKVKGTQGNAAKEVIKALKAQTEADKKKEKVSLNNLEFSKKERNEKIKGIKDTLNQAKQEKTLSGNRVKGLKGQQKQLAKMTGKAGMKGMMAGAKALGPLLKKAMGPVSIILMVKDAIQFFVDAMFQASKTTAELRQNLGVSADEAENIRKRFNRIATSTKEFNGAIKDVTITQKQIIQSQKELNSTLGTTIDFSKDFGEEGKSLLRVTSLLKDNFNLSEGAVQNLVKEQVRSGRTAENITESVLAEIEFRNNLNSTAIDGRQILEDIAKLSFNIQGMYGGQAEELAAAVYEARKLGFELNDLQSASGNLLDFENSISKELEAELILGRDLNLEKARQFALSNDMVGVARELRAQNIDIVELQKTNAIAAEAAASAMGLTVDQAVKGQLALEEQMGIEERLAEFRNTENKKLEFTDEKGKKRLITYQQLQNSGIKELKDLASQAQIDFDDLAKIVGKQRVEGLLAEDAQKKFSKSLERAKEQFANLVDSGVIDKLASALTGFINNSLVKKFIQEGEKEQRAQDAKKKIEAEEKAAKEAKAKGITPQEASISKEQLETLESAEYEHTAAGAGTMIAGGAATGAAIGSLFFGAGALPGAAIGAGVGAIASLFASSVEKSNEAAANEVARELGLNEIGATSGNIFNPKEVEDNPTDFTKIDVNDAIIRPNQKQIVIPDKQDVITTFKPQGIIDKTLSSAGDLAQPLATAMFPIVGTISSLFNSLTSPSTPEVPDNEKTLRKLELELLKGEKVDDNVTLKELTVSLGELRRERSAPPESTTVDDSELVKQIIQLRKDLNELNNRPIQVESTINLDGNRMGTALGMASYRTQ